MKKIRLLKQRIKELPLAGALLILRKDRGGKEIIAEIGLVVVAVTLLLIFRTQISGIISTIMTKASSEINSLFS